jgi:hypothetical protein
VKLADGVSGTSQLTIKDTDNNIYYNLNEPVQASDNEWVLLTADHVYESDYNLFLYVKGPAVENGVGGDYYIDDFSLVPYGSPAVDFQNDNNILDIGAYEYMGSTMSIDDNILGNIENIILFPNPATELIILKNISSESQLAIFDLLGKQHTFLKLNSEENSSLIMDISSLKPGIYFLRIKDSFERKSRTLRFIKK